MFNTETLDETEKPSTPRASLGRNGKEGLCPYSIPLDYARDGKGVIFFTQL